MNFVNLAHCAFGMLGGYIAVTVMRQFGVPFLARTAGRLPRRGGRQRRVRADAVSPALPGRRAQPGAVHDRPGVRGGRDGGLHLRDRHSSRSRCPRFLRGSVEIRRNAVRRLPALPHRRGAADHGACCVSAWSARASARGCAPRSTISASRRGWGSTSTRIFAVTFALGSGLAGLGGALAIEIVGLDPSFGFHYLVYVLIVVAVGGLGSIAGSFVGAALLGIGDVAGKYFVPEIGVVPDLPAAGGDPVRAPARPVSEGGEP